jgi:hypothetical protein|tara:strand:- start:1883 stop:2143 length:261 start_codon:yes stop_codon:yes gene_type:complete
MSHEINAGNVNEADLGNIMRHKAEVETALGRAYDSAAAIGHELGIHQERSRISSALDAVIDGVLEETSREALLQLKELIITPGVES